MEIIEHGNTYNVTSCPNCNAMFSYVKKDITTKDIVNIDFGEPYHTYIEYIKCPECNKQIKLKFQINGEDVK